MTVKQLFNNIDTVDEISEWYSYLRWKFKPQQSEPQLSFEQKFRIGAKMHNQMIENRKVARAK